MTRAGGADPRRRTARAGEQLRAEGGLPAHRLSAWEEDHPGLRAGVTAGAEAGDLGIASDRPPAEWLERMEAALSTLGGRGVALPRQVHGSRVVEVSGRPRGVLVPGEADGLSTDETGTFLAVTVADCVPVFVLDTGGVSGGVSGGDRGGEPGGPDAGGPGRGSDTGSGGRGLALLHAGWRGAAEGVLEAGLSAMEDRYGSRRSELLVHLGPAICGSCYEVGPEVPRALGRGAGGDAGGGANGKVRLDLRAELADRAASGGVPAENVSRSAACTRCGADHFFSYRGTGTAKRMVAFLGWRTGEAGV